MFLRASTPFESNSSPAALSFGQFRRNSASTRTARSNLSTISLDCAGTVQSSRTLWTTLKSFNTAPLRVKQGAAFAASLPRGDAVCPPHPDAAAGTDEEAAVRHKLGPIPSTGAHAAVGAALAGRDADAADCPAGGSLSAAGTPAGTTEDAAGCHGVDPIAFT